MPAHSQASCDSLEPKPGVFATTHWSVVLAASQAGSPSAIEALERLCSTYWYPLYVYVRRRGYNEPDARDLTQGFFAHLLERDALQCVSAEKPPVEMLAFSPDGQAVLAWAGNGVRVWDLSTKRERFAVVGFRPAFSPNGKRLVVGKGFSATLFDLDNGVPIHTFTDLTGEVHGTAFSPDGREVAAWADDDTVKTWDAQNGGERVTIKCNADSFRLNRNTGFKKGSIQSLAYSSDSRELIASGMDGFVRIWDSATGRELQVLAGDGSGFSSAVLSPDGRFVLAAGNNDRSARVWERSTAKERLVLRGHADLVQSAIFSPDGNQILTASWDQTARLWDFKTGRELRVFKGHEHWVKSAAFSPLGDLIASGDRNGVVKIWSLRSSGGSLLLSGHSNAVKTASFSPDGKRIATAGSDHTVVIWDIDQGKEIFTFGRHQSPVESAIFSPDGQRLLSASLDGTALLWRSTTGETIHQFKGLGMANYAGAIAFSQDGKRIAVGSQADEHCFVRVWNAEDGALVATTPPTSASCALAFSLDGRLIATANWDWVARLWDAKTGEQLRIFWGHSNWVRSVAFSRGGKRLLSASEDRTLKVWDVASGKVLLTLKGHKDHIYGDPSGGTAAYQGLPKANLVLVTHEHNDHFDTNVLEGLKGTNTTLIAPQRVFDLLPASLKSIALVMTNGAAASLLGLTVEAVPAYNITPGRAGHPKGRDNGYVLTLGGKRIYISGDTEDTPEMRSLKNIDVAFLCMTIPSNMTADQAASAVRDFKPGIVYPNHIFNARPGNFHGSAQDVMRFKRMIGNSAGTEVRVRPWYSNF